MKTSKATIPFQDVILPEYKIPSVLSNWQEAKLRAEHRKIDLTTPRDLTTARNRYGIPLFPLAYACARLEGRKGR